MMPDEFLYAVSIYVQKKEDILLTSIHRAIAVTGINYEVAMFRAKMFAFEEYPPPVYTSHSVHVMAIDLDGFKLERKNNE